MNMDRGIFDLNASVEATSLYILLCALMDGGQSPTIEEALEKWPGTEETLLAAAEELIRRCVLEVLGQRSDFKSQGRAGPVSGGTLPGHAL